MRLALLLLTGLAAFGQTIDLSAWDKLKSKAKESSTVTLTAETLGMALGALDKGTSPENAEAKEFVRKLKGVIVRTLEFPEKGAYTQSDVDAVRKQLGGPGWTKIIESDEKEEHVEIWFRNANGQGGLTILATEPRELTFVHVEGAGDLGSLMKATKMFKGANLDGMMSGKPATKPPKKNPKNDDE